VDENLRHDGGVSEERENAPAAATRGAAKNVDGEDPFEECGPVEAASEDGGGDAGGGEGGSVVGGAGCGRHHLGPGGGVRSEDTVVPGEVAPRGWDERGEPTEEFEGREHERRGAAPSRALQAVDDFAIGGQREARKRERRPARVACEPLEPEPIVGSHVSAGV